MHASPLEQRIRAMIEPSLEAAGYALVMVHLGDGKRKTLKILAERKDGKGMSVADCSEISNTASVLLDVEDPIPGAYDLEVSSPGMDRPLVSAADFERFRGEAAKVECALPIDGRKRFSGQIEGVEGEALALVTAEGRVVLPFGNIRTARLAPTEEDYRKKLKGNK